MPINESAVFGSCWYGFCLLFTTAAPSAAGITYNRVIPLNEFALNSFISFNMIPIKNSLYIFYLKNNKIQYNTVKNFEKNLTYEKLTVYH